MEEPHSLNFRVITTHFLGVRIFRKFTGATNISLIKMRFDDNAAKQLVNVVDLSIN